MSWMWCCTFVDLADMDLVAMNLTDVASWICQLYSLGSGRSGLVMGVAL